MRKDSLLTMAHKCCALGMNRLQLSVATSGNLPRLRDVLTTKNVNDTDGRGCTALHWAALEGHSDCVKYCLQMGANVNARDENGSTALHFASGLDETVALLDAGALIDVADDFEHTPLHATIRFKLVGVMKLLVDRGAKVSNVKLDSYLPNIPYWATTFVTSRLNCRSAAIIVIGIHKYHRTNITGNDDINVLKLVSKHIWSTRMDDDW
jgi:hypothetical protein